MHCSAGLCLEGLDDVKSASKEMNWIVKNLFSSWFPDYLCLRRRSFDDGLQFQRGGGSGGAKML